MKQGRVHKYTYAPPQQTTPLQSGSTTAGLCPKYGPRDKKTLPEGPDHRKARPIPSWFSDPSLEFTNFPFAWHHCSRRPGPPQSEAHSQMVFRSFLGVYQFSVRLAPPIPKAPTAAKRSAIPSGFLILPWSLPIFRSPGTTFPEGLDRRKARPTPKRFSDPSLEFTNFPFAWHHSSERPRPPQSAAPSPGVF